MSNLDVTNRNLERKCFDSIATGEIKRVVLSAIIAGAHRFRTNVIRKIDSR